MDARESEFEVELRALRRRRQESPLTVHGGRNARAAELIGSDARHFSKMGEWVEVPRDVAEANSAVRRWCLAHSNSESPTGGFVFEKKAYALAGREFLPLPFLPEHHDPRREVRRLARTERLLRSARVEVEHLEAQRAWELCGAAEAGLSRRELAQIVGLSPARVQQLVAQGRDAPNG
jgi:hypothetical protein